MHISPAPLHAAPAVPAPSRPTALAHAAQEFEAAILTEVLLAAGAGKTDTQFAGGIGEDQFASLLVNAQARAMSAAGGIGLAEIVLRGLLAQDTPEQAP
ncbi:MAG: rod-binding protein [Roseinatronobacter sp.]